MENGLFFGGSFSYEAFFFVSLTTAIIGHQNQLTFTDVQQDKRLLCQQIIAEPSGTKGDPVKCLTRCLANSGKCKSINVNKDLGKCELLGQSTNDGLKLSTEEGWVYYGPKELKLPVHFLLILWLLSQTSTKPLVVSI